MNVKLTGTQIREYTRDYQRLVEKYANEGIVSHTRERIAKDMGLSIQQADRYKKINSLISEIQELVYSDVLGMSNSFPIATHFAWEQHEIKEILFDAIRDNCTLTRPCVKHIVDEYRSGKRHWKDIKATYVHSTEKAATVPLKITTTTHTETSLEAIRKMSGDEFVLWFSELLKNIGFKGISIGDASHDEGADIIAQKNGIHYCFQCKNQQQPVRKTAFKEVYYGKPANCNIPVVVATGSIAKTAILSGEKRGIQAWDGKYLAQLIKDAYQNGD